MTAARLPHELKPLMADEIVLATARQFDAVQGGQGGDRHCQRKGRGLGLSNSLVWGVTVRGSRGKPGSGDESIPPNQGAAGSAILFRRGYVICNEAQLSRASLHR